MEHTACTVQQQGTGNRSIHALRANCVYLVGFRTVNDCWIVFLITDAATYLLINTIIKEQHNCLVSYIRALSLYVAWY